MGQNEYIPPYQTTIQRLTPAEREELIRLVLEWYDPYATPSNPLTAFFIKLTEPEEEKDIEPE